MSHDPSKSAEGWEAVAEEAEGSLGANEELERAIREAAEAVEAREGVRAPARGGPVAGAAELEALQAAEAKARGELAELQDRFLRLQADFDNFRRRLLKEREEGFQFGHQNLVKDLLPAVDNLERAIEHARRSEGGEPKALLQGIELVLRELRSVLGKHGVSEIEALGQPFDPAVHEAMAQTHDASVPQSTVVQVFQKGYQLRDRLLRPAQVVVSQGGPAAPQAPQDAE